MEIDEEMRRGSAASALLNDPLMQETLGKLKKEVIDRWAACPARDVQGREWLWQHYQVTLKFEELLTEIINTGKMATQMHKEQTMGERIRKVVGL